MRAPCHVRLIDDQSTNTQSTAPISESTSGVTFAQRSTGVRGTNGVLHDQVLALLADTVS